MKEIGSDVPSSATDAEGGAGKVRFDPIQKDRRIDGPRLRSDRTPNNIGVQPQRHLQLFQKQKKNINIKFV